MFLVDRFNKRNDVVEHEPFKLRDVASAKQLAKNSSPFRVLLRIPIVRQPFVPSKGLWRPRDMAYVIEKRAGCPSCTNSPYVRGSLANPLFTLWIVSYISME